jgi:hypothetical protein
VDIGCGVGTVAASVSFFAMPELQKICQASAFDITQHYLSISESIFVAGDHIPVCFSDDSSTQMPLPSSTSTYAESSQSPWSSQHSACPGLAPATTASLLEDFLQSHSKNSEICCCLLPLTQSGSCCFLFVSTVSILSAGCSHFAPNFDTKVDFKSYPRNVLSAKSPV